MENPQLNANYENELERWIADTNLLMGDHRDFNSYISIMLLDVTYKILATIIR